MLKHVDHFHGSDLEKIEQVYGIKKEEIVSFSANVNPLGISPLMREALLARIDCITSYPDREYTSLRRQIGAYTGAPLEHITVGNGSTELISLFIQLEHPKKALILGPTYSEYEREISLGGGTSLYYPLKEENGFVLDVADFQKQLNETLDLLVICNPNNPTSSAIPQAAMRQILDACKRCDIYVMIDETYVEFAPDYDAITSVPLTRYYNNLIILRGVSKFFAAPGLRLGYAVTGNEDLMKRINSRKNPWTINSLAAVAGELMFSDKEYIAKTRALTARERTRITKELKAWGTVKPYDSYANFLLLRIEKEGVTAEDLFEHAIRRKMMIRNCSTFPFLNNRYIRFCFMAPEQNDALLSCLRELL
ncbi:MAG: aminotransferase class I/II-fold pyridoxal phosphate-dependent enzyme [Lachnospiraceae bacterium]|jgi:threonine-phosphate decarboxylase|nr:aminotransferase class I/II-fold pyridoxal phosphate-dependent enzyme [Lachnospiraceae bacterium]